MLAGEREASHKTARRCFWLSRRPQQASHSFGHIPIPEARWALCPDCHPWRLSFSRWATTSADLGQMWIMFLFQEKGLDIGKQMVNVKPQQDGARLPLCVCVLRQAPAQWLQIGKKTQIHLQPLSPPLERGSHRCGPYVHHLWDESLQQLLPQRLQKGHEESWGWITV